MRRSTSSAILLVLYAFCALTPTAIHAASPQAVSDSLYNSNHPRLLFTESDVPALYAKVRDGGQDDVAWIFIRNRVDNVYMLLPVDALLEDDYGFEQIMNLGMATYLEAPYDTVSRDMGRDLTLMIADSFAVDVDIYASSLRLRNMALGYDLFFAGATESQRGTIIDEIGEYLVEMLTSADYNIWHYRPYTSNKTAMLAAALGLAAICLEDELAPGVSAAALVEADDHFFDWLATQLDLDGAYREGLLYGLWSMRHLIYYFEARERYDGVDYSLIPAIRKMEEWIVYELDPRGVGHTNNLNDCTDFFRPLSRHTTYFDWAQTKWGSGLGSYIFLHGPGGFGVDMGDHADKAATALWAQPITPVDPATTLPASKLWTGRGLYYYRTGWPQLFDSDDTAFSFYSGVFQGGHAQEDQNHFTLTAFGEKLVTDHGAGNPAKESEAHGVILIDGAGQHNAGASIGTDGLISAYLLGDYMDYVVGDATQAYTTYSPYNENGVPFPGIDWSWGHHGANPVNFALRKIITVREAETNPYFVIVDEIEKDGAFHDYEWRLHTAETNAVDDSANPIQVTGTDGAMEVYVANPCFDSLTTAVTYFDNGAEDDNANVLSVTVNAVNPHLVTILLPRSAAATPPTITTGGAVTGGTVTTIDWGNGYSDAILTSVNNCGSGTHPPGSGPQVFTDAEVAVLRFFQSALVRYMMTNGTYLWYGGIEQVRVDDGPASVSKSDTYIYIDRLDADFVVYSPEDLQVWFHDIVIPTTRSGSYLLSATTSSVGDAPSPAAAVTVRAFPNPLNPDVRITVTSPSRAAGSADVYDVAGRHVARVWEGVLAAGDNRFTWDGTDAGGGRVSSGIYFLRVRAGAVVRTTKLTVLK